MSKQAAPSRPSEINMKNWRAKVRPVLTSTSFDPPFMIQSHAESTKEIMGALLELPAN